MLLKPSVCRPSAECAIYVKRKRKNGERNCAPSVWSEENSPKTDSAQSAVTLLCINLATISSMGSTLSKSSDGSTCSTSCSYSSVSSCATWPAAVDVICYFFVFTFHHPITFFIFSIFLSFFHLNLPSTHFRFSFALSPLVKCSILITLKLQRYQLSPSAFYRYRKHSAVSEKNSAYWSSVVVQCTEKIDDDLAEIEELCHFFLFQCHSLFLPRRQWNKICYLSHVGIRPSFREVLPVLLEKFFNLNCLLHTVHFRPCKHNIAACEYECKCEHCTHVAPPPFTTIVDNCCCCCCCELENSLKHLSARSGVVAGRQTGRQQQ